LIPLVSVGVFSYFTDGGLWSQAYSTDFSNGYNFQTANFLVVFQLPSGNYAFCKQFPEHREEDAVAHILVKF